MAAVAAERRNGRGCSAHLRARVRLTQLLVYRSRRPGKIAFLRTARLPGVYFLHRGVILASFRYKLVVGRPDYLRFATPYWHRRARQALAFTTLLPHDSPFALVQLGQLGIALRKRSACLPVRTF